MLINFLKSLKVRIFLTLLISFLLVISLVSKEVELTPRTLAGKLIKLIPSKIAALIYQHKKTPQFSTIVLSKEKLQKTKLIYNNEEFEVYIDPNIELTQEKIKLLYFYWKIVNK